MRGRFSSKPSLRRRDGRGFLGFSASVSASACPTSSSETSSSASSNRSPCQGNFSLRGEATQSRQAQLFFHQSEQFLLLDDQGFALCDDGIAFDNVGLTLGQETVFFCDDLEQISGREEC